MSAMEDNENSELNKYNRNTSDGSELKSFYKIRYNDNDFLKNANHYKKCVKQQRQQKKQNEQRISEFINKTSEINKLRRYSIANTAIVGDFAALDVVTPHNGNHDKKTFLKSSNFKYKRREISTALHNIIINVNRYCLLFISELIWCIKKVCQYARCVKMLNNFSIGYILLMIVFVSLGFTDMTEAGACWVARMSNGKCKELYSKNISKDECCKYGQEFAYTDKDLSDVEYFFAAAIGDGANCVSCLDSCDVAKCGVGKRCIIRKGRPKCVCAPICKASKDKKLKKTNNNNLSNNHSNNNNSNSIRVIDIGQNEKLTQFNFDILSKSRKISSSLSNVEQQQQQQQQQQQHKQNDWFSSLVPFSVPFSISERSNQQNIEQQQTERVNLINNSTTVFEGRKKKNQRKSDLTKRRNQHVKLSSSLVVNENSKLDDSEKQQHRKRLKNRNEDEDDDDEIKHDNRSRHSTKLEPTVKLKKNLNAGSKNIVVVQSSPSESAIREIQRQQQQQHHQHHSRHEYKKRRKFQKQQKLQYNSASQNITTPLNAAATVSTMITNVSPRKYQQQQQQQQHHHHHHPTSRIQSTKMDSLIPSTVTTETTTQYQHQQRNYYQQMTLDEKIRNGFFSHGFPYSQDYLTEQHQMTHGRYYNPVCGSDGKTYKTECQLKKRACRRETSLTVAYRGHCQTSCKLVHCLDGLTCVEDQYGIPHCISCTISCPQDDAMSDVIDPTRAVCGVDGRTYKSICDINRMICTTGRSIAVAYYGPCQESANCNNIHCGQRKICLTDLVTHKPRCISCSFKCPRRRRPQGQRYEDVKICGNNNHTYFSWCHMRRDSCNTEFYIDVRHIGPCHRESFTVDEKSPLLY